MSDRRSSSSYESDDLREKELLFPQEYRDLEQQNVSPRSTSTFDGALDLSPRYRVANTLAFLTLWPRRRCTHLAWLVAAVLCVALLFRIAFIPHISGVSLQRLGIGHNQNWESIDTLFFFGDSYTSTLMSQMEKSPPRLVKKLEIGDTGEYRAKPNWVTFWTEVYNQTTYTTYNFATGGSTVDSRVVKPYMAGTSFYDQLRDFTRWYGRDVKAAEWQPQKTLFTAWFGVNDIALTHSRSREAFDDHHRPSMPQVFESYGSLVNQLYDIGARNFLFLTCPPVDLSRNLHPQSEFRMQEKMDETTDVMRFNARLYEMRDVLRENFTDINVAIFDAHRFWERVIETPSEYPQTADITHPSGICTESLKEDMPINGTYLNNTCQDGALIRQHMWTNMHATFPIHNATAAQVVEDCMGPGGLKHYCS